MTASVVVSLDFELRWGLLDILGDDITRYRRNLEGVAEAIPRLLDLFSKRDVHATWATVGAVACESWDEWQARTPPTPRYDDVGLRWRESFRTIDPRGRLYFAPDLVNAIRSSPGQELGSHTFNHVYVREPGFSREDAIADADAVVSLFRDRWDSRPSSVVFPRNQVGHTDVLRTRGVTAWRENPHPSFWNATAASEQTRIVRLCRIADAMAPLGRRTAPAVEHRASFFVRMNLAEPLWRAHRRRIVADARALRAGEVLHLWWHPHNLGASPEKSVARIADLLDAVREAAPPSTRFRSMSEVAGLPSKTH